MIGSIVLLQLAAQYTLAAVSAVHTPDDVDLRAFVLYADGTLGCVEIPHSKRGTGVNEWIDMPNTKLPQLEAVAPRLMPVGNLPAVQPMPTMVIIRF
jgi:hypothetical protein